MCLLELICLIYSDNPPYCFKMFFSYISFFFFIPPPPSSTLDSSYAETLVQKLTALGEGGGAKPKGMQYNMLFYAND